VTEQVNVKSPKFDASPRQKLLTDHKNGMRDYVTDGNRHAKILMRSFKGIMLSTYVILLCFLMWPIFTFILWVLQFWRQP